VRDEYIEKDVEKILYRIKRKGRRYPKENIEKVDPQRKWEPVKIKGVEMSIAATPPSPGFIRDHLHEDSEINALADVAEKYFEKNPSIESI
jgi:hypothetical protein